MKIVGVLKLILEVLKELFSYGKKAENEKLEKLKRGIGCAVGSNLKYTPHEIDANNKINT